MTFGRTLGLFASKMRIFKFKSTILRLNEIKQMKSQSWGMEELMEYFRKSGEKFGNPKVIELEKPAAFDLRWDAKPPLTLRWTWSDPYAVRIEPEEGSLLAVGISGAYDHHAHVKLANPANPWLYVSERYVDYPGKVEATTIDQCLTKEGEWMKEALEAGVKYLADLG
jgi:hypothetical protein